MANIQFLFESELLVEISLQDHYDKFGDKFNVDDYERYQQIAKLDPTSNDGKIKGKYTEWLLKQFGDMSVEEFENYIEDNDIYKWLEGLGNVKGFDINQYKSLDVLKDYYNSLDEEDLLSSKEKKRRQKDVLQSNEHIKVIYKDSDYLVAKPITKQGNILLARYKCPESAKWCTADPNGDYHWEEYMELGALFTVIPLADPEEKFHVYAKDGRVDECRDFNDDDYMEDGLEILKQLDEKSEGELRGKMGVEEFERSPLVLEIRDEDAAIHYIFDYIFGDAELFDSFNRPPSDTELDTEDYTVAVVSDLDIKTLFQKFMGHVIDYGFEGERLYVENFIEVLEKAVEAEHMTKMEIESFFNIVADEEFENMIDNIGGMLEDDIKDEENPKQYVIDFLDKTDIRDYIQETILMLINYIEADMTINKPWEDEEEVLDRILDYLNIEESKKPTWAKFI